MNDYNQVLNEIVNDPDKIGYKTTREITTVNTVVDPETKEETTTTVTETVPCWRSLDEIKTLLNTPVNAFRKDNLQINRAYLLIWLTSRGVLIKLKDIVDNNSPYLERLTDEQKYMLRSIAYAAILLVTGGAESLNLEIPQNVQMIDALIVFGVITQADKDNLYENMVKLPTSRAEHLWGATISEDDMNRFYHSLPKL